MHLRELPLLQREIDADLEEAGGEITPEIQAKLDRLDEEIGHKVDWVGTVVAERNGEALVYDAEIKRLQAKKKAVERSVESLKDYLKLTMETMKLERAEGRLHSVTIQKASRSSIVWTRDFDKLPAAFIRTKVELDGQAAYDAWRAGTLPEGFEARTSTFPRIR